MRARANTNLTLAYAVGTTCAHARTQLLRQMQQSVEAASGAEVIRVAQLLMAALAKVEPVPDARHWFKLYRFME